MLDVELGLYLLRTVMPTRPAADAWTLFGGYPYGEAFGDVHSEAQRLMIRRARHHLWDMRRRREWRRSVQEYLTVPLEYRGYHLADIDAVPERRDPAHAADRFEVYERLLTSPPAFERKPLPIASVGQYWFPVRDRRHAVTFTEDLLATIDPMPRDSDELPSGDGASIEPTWAELEAAAAEMDAIEAEAAGGRRNAWSARLARVRLLMRAEAAGEFVPADALRIDSLLHMVGMVGAGKSTVRDILTYWAAQRGLRVTIVVGDVAEELAVTETFRGLGILAAPVIGHSTRERHIQRLHRRMATAGVPTMLAHRHSGFDHLSSACPLDALRGLDAAAPLRIGEAPCTRLFPVSEPHEAPGHSVFNEEPEEPGPPAPPPAKHQRRHGCPLWSGCPRQRAARELVDARVWVATPASLVHSGVPQHLTDRRLRYLEHACRNSDLVVVDEADRVQMQLDTAFAPSTTLVGRSPNSWLDEVASHKLDELARHGRIQLSAQDVAAWTGAVDTVTIATNRIYSLLVQDEHLRRWITVDYFSAFTLHQWLINSWFPDLREGASDDLLPPGATRETRLRLRDTIDDILDRFRDDPLLERETRDDGDTIAPVVGTLVHLALELLHAQDPTRTRDRLRLLLLNLLGQDPHIAERIDEHATRLEFTLLLAALHHRLDFMTMLWPMVEAALNLDNTSNVLSRRPPRDYEPIIPESPMGNVLGFQFQAGDRDANGDQSGELRFFRCSGIGRELLHSLHELPSIDDRPRPQVLLMSATSWAGTSSRYHIHIPVAAVLVPREDEVKAVLRTTFRKEFLTWPATVSPGRPAVGQANHALRLSGSDPESRPLILREMLRQLAVPDRTLTNAASLLDQELADIDDPDRRRLLLLVGSYAEAKRAAEYLNAIPEWSGRVTQLVSDDADLDDTWQTLRRGDVATFPRTSGEVLVAPLLAVERGHNIVMSDGKAAIGTAYFLARPHPRPDDIALAIQAVNDWAVRYVRSGQFHQAALAAGSPDAAALAFRRDATHKWNRFLTRRLSWTSLPSAEKTAFTWDQLVVMWQVIGRLVRGGVPARVVFVDAAFSPREAGLNAVDTPATSLLASMKHVLAPYFSADSLLPSIDKSLVSALYEPLYRALTDID